MAGIVALVAFATIRSVHAEDPVPVQLDFEGAKGCAEADAFTREVLARAPRARIATPTEHARRLVAHVRAPGAHGYDGVLVVREGGGPASERNVHAPSCNELVTALAVIAAFVIDPITARTGPMDAIASTADAAPEASSTVEPPTPPAASASASAPDAGAGDAATPPAPAPTVVEAPPVRPHPSDRWEWSVGAGGGAIGGSAPSLLFGVSVFLEVSRRTSTLFEPALRVRFERTATASSEDGEFSRTGGALDLCPLALHARSLRAQPCARVEVAALHAKGLGVEPANSDLRPWASFGPLLRVRLDLAPPLFLELEGGVLIAGVRDRFFVEPATLVYRAPLVGATTGFALGLAF